MESLQVTLTHLFRSKAMFPLLTAPAEPPSRLCELTWLEPALFGPTITVLSIQSYKAISAILGYAVQPGMLGEQIVISQPLESVKTFQLGDAIIKVLHSADLKLSDQFQGSSGSEEFAHIWAMTVSIVEDGLVEPGALARVID